ncbi:MAG: AI-2E family transporter [Anaerolineae bacterium]|nr:AI-2E family transporter [Anaerolineae bacterium]
MTVSSSSPASDQWSARRIIFSTLVVLALAAGFLLLYQTRQVVVIFFTAIIIGTALKPVTDKLSERGVPPLFGGILMYAVVTGALLLFLVLLFPVLFEQMNAMFESLPEYYNTVRATLSQSPNLFLQQISWRLPSELAFASLSGDVVEDESETLMQTLAMVGFTLKATFITIATLMLSLYWTLDSERAIRSALLILPSEHRDSTREMIDEMQIKVGAYIRGQAILCLSIGVMALIAYLWIGVPYAIVLALFAGLMEAVPYIGPVLGAVPALLVAASIAPDKAIWVAVATLIIQQLENTFLAPGIMSKAVGVNTFVALLAIFAFGSLGGILGVLLAIPAAAILQMLLNRFVLNQSTLEQQQNEFGRDKLSRLRYHTQDLIQDVRKQIRDDELVPEDDDAKLIEEDIEAIASDLESILAQSNGKSPQ